MSWEEELAKNFPVEKAYDDVAAPAAKQIGSALESATKAARWLLAPIDYLAARNDRYQNYLERISKIVPEENLIEGNPKIVGPALDGLKYVSPEDIISDLFVNLLARAIDKERVNEAHPAFTQIISQLSPDEAVVIYELSKQSYEYVTYAAFHSGTNTFSPREVRSNQFPVENLAAPENYSFYIDHLHSLNIAGIWQVGNQTPIRNEEGQQIGVEINSTAQLTPFGQLFAKACVPENIERYV
ncbi:MAG: DUF4393 domain-containing protein [Gammaproteobacteria bacterium]